MIQKVWKCLVEGVRETLNLAWTLIGLIISILTLSGASRTITFYATIITLAIWLLTIRVRK